jgi:hypothetical protein
MRLQASAQVDHAERQALGITVRDTEPTPVGPPETRPVLAAGTRQRLRILVSFYDEGASGQKAKPAGVRGCEIWVKVDGAPPADVDECQYLATDTATPYPGAVRRRGRGQDGALYRALGEHAGRTRPDQRDRERDRAGLGA